MTLTGAEGGPPVVVATFLRVADAEIARGHLESEEIPCALEGAHTVDLMWHLGAALGGVRLVVPHAHADRARELLGRVASAPAGQLSVVSALGADEDGDPAAGEPYGPLRSPRDDLARRAFFAAGIGLVLAPVLLHLWSLSLVARWSREVGYTSRAASRQIGAAVVIDLIVLGAGLILLVDSFG